jgi:hypothetical protein
VRDRGSDKPIDLVMETVGRENRQEER